MIEIQKKTMEEYKTQWTTINWADVENYIFGLQVKIYKATLEGNFRTVKSLQRLIVNSWRGKLLAVRKVTQDNRGKRTAGIDKKKNLNEKERILLAEKLHINGKCKPARRIYIPKPNGKERPLGIPTMEDRAKQALVKMALEPEWEAKFEPDSYGFRPGRKCEDAINQIHKHMVTGEKFILDADITGCFDNINHEKLLEQIQNNQKIKMQIKAWLKAGIIEWKTLEYKETETGTPQGGVISPLLANIALHGMEHHVKEELYKWGYRLQYLSKGKPKNYNKARTFEKIGVIRYADDFVIITYKKEATEKAKEIITEWLEERGLKLNQEKTKVVSNYEGFDFLGFNVRKYKVGKHRDVRNVKGEHTNEVVHTKVSKESLLKFYRKLAELIDKYKTASAEILVAKLTPVIQGWCNYYKHSSSKHEFSRLDNLLWRKLWQWAKRRHSKKSSAWIARKYFLNNKTRTGNKWDFGQNDYILTKPSKNKTGIEYVKVQGLKSPYDGDYEYWANRLEGYNGLTIRKQELFRKQKGRCARCQEKFKISDILETDHKTAKMIGGKDEWGNVQLLHHYCHDSKTAEDFKQKVSKV